MIGSGKPAREKGEERRLERDFEGGEETGKLREDRKDKWGL